MTSAPSSLPSKPTGQIILYKSEDGSTRVEVRMQDETVWLPQKAMAELFETSVPNIAMHLKNCFTEGELDTNSVIQEFLITAEDGKQYKTKCYSLDAILSVGYRVKSKTATQFRIWATRRLKEYIVKGFALDDERLKQGGGMARYFEELLQRIRDIRSSERNFYQKVTDIYATSIDYRKDGLLTQQFFATVQNKMHYAVHGHTAAEIIHQRADSSKPMMGLTSFNGRYITSGDVRVAKNYLSEKELKQLNLIVSLYLDFAELQASNERPMTMSDWVNKLDEFLKLSEKKLLKSAGTISAETAGVKAEAEFLKYRNERDKKNISDFDREMKKLSGSDHA
ncbi:virulence RhuM family protein [Candidatus Peregrinibacteria bacterium]|nr:virulence RhuM family protein [Candidatus Peregrinibacteria bacterium]MBI3816381.1 virulence RhuM family protein [Candidatus Peregrinibacteria bacterium]